MITFFFVNIRKENNNNVFQINLFLRSGLTYTDIVDVAIRNIDTLSVKLEKLEPGISSASTLILKTFLFH